MSNSTNNNSKKEKAVDYEAIRGKVNPAKKGVKPHIRISCAQNGDNKVRVKISCYGHVVRELESEGKLNKELRGQIREQVAKQISSGHVKGGWTNEDIKKYFIDELHRVQAEKRKKYSKTEKKEKKAEAAK
jgi:hypothetical protein